MLRILALEPYYGGSHKAFLDGYRAQSRHRVEPLTMPAHKWKWRMRGAALAMHRRIRQGGRAFDVLLVSDYLDLAALVALRPPLPEAARVAYFHENQFTYPVPTEEERDYQFGFTNVTTCLAADRVLFNSRHNMESFLQRFEELLGLMPDEVPAWAPAAIRERAEVVPVGVDLASVDELRGSAAPRAGPLTVLWNHRWEYDKGADAFFRIMAELAGEGREFELVVTGQQFRRAPAVFAEARERLAGRVRQFGYVESREDYLRLLLDSDVVVSTARHEFFGIAAVEALYAGCAALLPHGLSYPELIAPQHHGACLYEGEADLKARLARWMERPGEARALDLREDVRRFGWDRVAPRLDAAVERACEEAARA